MRTHSTPLRLIVLAAAVACCLAAPASARTRPRPRMPVCPIVSERQMQRPLTLTRGCYRIDLFNEASAPIVVLAGVTIVFGPAAALVIGPASSLDVRGTAARPVIFRGADLTPGSWDGIQIGSTNVANHLRFTRVEGAGVNLAEASAIFVAPGARLSMNDSTVRYSKNAGLYVDQRATLGVFARNHFDHNGTPIDIKASDVASIDRTTTYAHDLHEFVVIHFGDTIVADDAVWHALAIPYFFRGSPSIQSHVTIESGTHLVFSANQTFGVDSAGTLVANGATFTGESDVPGYWNGILIQSPADNRLDAVVVKNAGLSFGGAVTLFPKCRANLTHSTLSSSSSAGVLVGQNAVINPDVATSNQFVDDKDTVVYQP